MNIKFIEKLHFVLTTKPDKSTDEGRRLERYRCAALTSMTLMFSRVVNIATGLLLIPITLQYLGADRFGLWMTISSFVAFMEFTDLGLGVGLQNLLIECNGRDDFQSPKNIIGNALLLMVSIFILLTMLGIYFLPFFDWSSIIKVTDPLIAGEILPAIQAGLIAFAFGLPMGLIQRVCDAYQKGYFGYFCLLIGRISGFLHVLLCAWLGLPLWALVGGFIGFPFVFMMFGWMIALWKVPFLRPWPFSMDFSCMWRMMKIGCAVMGSRFAYAMVNSGPSLLIANLFSAAAVTPFAITQKLFGATTIVTMSTMSSLWGAYGEAAERGDWFWINRTLKKSTMLIAVFLLPTIFLMVFLGKPIIEWWSQNPDVVPSTSMLLACALFSIAQALKMIYGIFLNGINRITIQAIHSVVFACIAFIVSIIVGAQLGADGLVWLFATIGYLIPSLLLLLESFWVLKKKALLTQN